MIRIRPAETEQDLATIHTLFREYAAQLGFDLDFQDFERELAELPGAYAPLTGALLLAEDEEGAAGCVALRPFAPHVCEMKRLYVRPTLRARGAGRALASAIIQAARAVGYRAMRLDTTPSMTRAIALYRSLGFREIEPYRPNPIPGAIFMELTL
jgi:ribosomal protein S18 acetylase RimI-like enzyme